MRILICDDDVNYQNLCREQIEKIVNKNQLDVTIDTVGLGEELLFFLDTKFNKIDLLYLDYHLEKMNGMEVAAELRKKGYLFDIVFYTVDPSFAVDAFDVNAYHYIIKGVTKDEKFEDVFLKVAKKIQERNTEFISLSCAGEHRNIALDDILYFEVRSRIVTVHYYKNSKIERFEFYSTLSKLNEFLFDKCFIRVHSSYLVSKKNIYKKVSNEIEMKNGKMIPIGRSFKNKIKDIL